MFLSMIVPVLLIALPLAIPHFAVHQRAALRPDPNYPGFWFLAAIPFAEGIVGFLLTALFCWPYNRIAGFTGGIELNVVRQSETLIQPGQLQTRKPAE